MRFGVPLLSLCAAVAAAEAPRFWPKFSGSRGVSLLDGTWSFGLHLDDIDSMGQLDPTDPKWTPNKTAVPSCVDAVPPGYMGPRGVAAYRTKFSSGSARSRLQFMACSFYCRVWVDGKEVGDHRAGGYVPFWLDIPEADSGADAERELFVIADNRFNSTTAPMHTGGDFWHYGGLMRSVILHDMPKKDATPWVWRAYVLPTSLDKVDITIALTDEGFSGDVDLAMAFDDGTTAQGDSKTYKAVNGVVSISGVSVPNPRVWSTTDPQLHTLSVTIAGATVVERFGLRQWGVDMDTGRLTLNGKVIKLHGWNHHTQWPGVGASPRDDQMDSDLVQMRAAGTNYIRGAHYPQDQRWLDRLDEAGIAMWEETLGPGTSVKNLQDWDFFMKYQTQQLDEMMDQSLNHAAIMTWGWFNEGPSNKDEACPAYAFCANRSKTRDPTRFQTWASNQELNDKCLEHATLISFNNYPAWYASPGDLSAPAKHWNEMADSVREQYPGKPFAISETGAGGVYEWSDNKTDARWTLKYQTEVITRDVDTALSNNNISGLTLWHYFDFKGNDDATKSCGHCDYLPGVQPPTCGYIDVSCHRPGGENHKGVVGFWRREKPIYNIVGEKYKNATAWV